MILKNENQKNHLKDSNSNLTLKKDALKTTETPHYFEVRNLDGERYLHCGSELDAKYMCESYPGFTYHKVYLPHSPKTVNVPHIRLDDDLQLPAQQILPESKLEPFIPDYHD